MDIAIINISVYDQNGMYIRDMVRRMDLHQQNTGCGVRTINIWALKEKDVSILPSTEEERAKVRLQIRKTKTCNTSEPYYISCNCEYGQHDIANTRCPVTIATAHKQLKYEDYVQYVKPRKQDIVYEELPYFRRLRFLEAKDHDKGTYFCAQRWGEKHIRGNTDYLCKMANVDIVVPAGNRNRVRPTCLVRT